MNKTVMEQARDIRQHYRETAESITYTSGEHGTTSTGEQWTAAPGYGACIYQKQPGRLFAYVATVGEIWKPTTFDAVCLINQTRRTFDSRESARPAYDLFTV